MFLKTLRTAGLILACVTPAFATSTERQVVIEHYLSADWFESIRATSALPYVRTVQDRLREHSVVVLDAKRFAEMLPKTLTDASAAAVRAHLVSHCFDPMTERAVAILADHIERGVSSDDAVFGSAHYVAERDLALCLVRAHLLGIAAPEGARADLPVQYRADVARILATPGIAQFPNRIIKLDVIRSFQ